HAAPAAPGPLGPGGGPRHVAGLETERGEGEHASPSVQDRGTMPRVPFERAGVLQRALGDEQVVRPDAPGELEADPLYRAVGRDQAERGGDGGKQREHRGEHDERRDAGAPRRGSAHESARARRESARGEDEGGGAEERLELRERRQRRRLASRRPLARGNVRGAQDRLEEVPSVARPEKRAGEREGSEDAGVSGDEAAASVRLPAARGEEG